LTGLKLLLVDDSLDNQVLFHRALTAAGAETDLASNGAEAITLSAAIHYDAIIMDMRMPVVDGYNATAAIRQAGYRGPVIALTAHANPGEEERCRASGCSHFFLKPIDRRSLITAVQGAIQSSFAD
jgi:CheY-like chemotaxis protein